MDAHTFPASKADRLEDAARRYRNVSAEELLWALAPDAGDAVLDVGSGTGFYTDEVTPYARQVYALDTQRAMHARYREKETGMPANVVPVTADAGRIPFADDTLDGALTTMTFHEFPRETVAEVARVLDSGRFVVADWTAEGPGERGPPVDERETAAVAAESLQDAGFEVVFEATRVETFLVVGAIGRSSGLA